MNKKEINWFPGAYCQGKKLDFGVPTSKALFYAFDNILCLPAEAKPD